MVHAQNRPGNPIGNVVRSGNEVIVHSATGNDFKPPVLKTLGMEKKWKDPSADIAMSAVKSHLDKMECYGCHASWVPQCYGCHVKVDYSKDKKGKPYAGTDWVSSGNAMMKNGQTPESKLGDKGIKSPGKISESRSYLRWEDPVLGISGEGRVTPLMPGCQIVDREGIQLATVGTHWPMSRAFNKEELNTFLRAGTCMGCHQNMRAKELWVKVSTDGKLDPAKHLEMMNKMIQMMAEKDMNPSKAVQGQ